MSSKVFVSLPPDGFQQQINKKHQDILESDRAAVTITTTDPVVRVNQLEQNIKFLQDQHQIMLTGLHREIEILRQKNSDLQFQIIFDKKMNLAHSTSSSDEEFPKKFSFSPDSINITPLQIEFLERNVADLRTNLSEAKTKNVYLQNVIDEQKKKLSLLEKEKMNLCAMNKKCDKENMTKKFTESATLKKKLTVSQNYSENLQEKLEDADRLIRRLRRENEDRKKEIVSLRTSMNKGKTDVRKNDGNNGRKVYYRNGQSQTSRFPPLHGHTHWQHSIIDNQSEQISEQEKDRFNEESINNELAISSLPYLRDKNNASSSTGYGNYQVTNYKRWYHYHRKQDENRSNGRPSRREQSHQNRNDR